MVALVKYDTSRCKAGTHCVPLVLVHGIRQKCRVGRSRWIEEDGDGQAGSRPMPLRKIPVPDRAEKRRRANIERRSARVKIGLWRTCKVLNCGAFAVLG